jgi:hypothetical protein
MSLTVTLTDVRGTNKKVVRLPGFPEGYSARLQADLGENIRQTCKMKDGRPLTVRAIDEITYIIPARCYEEYEHFFERRTRGFAKKIVA